MNKNIICVPFLDIENAYVVISGYKADTGNGVRKCMSFFYNNEGVGAEWEPDHGPITIIYSCNEDNPEAQKHWFYDYCTGYSNWSQLAVNDEMLPEAFIDGNYEFIFLVLKKWSLKADEEVEFFHHDL